MYSELQRCHTGFGNLLFHLKFRPSWCSVPGHNFVRVLLPFPVPVFVELSTFGITWLLSLFSSKHALNAFCMHFCLRTKNEVSDIFRF